MRKNIFFLFIIISITFAACQSDESKEKPKNADPRAIEVEVKEVLQTSNYTYLKLDDYGDIYWAAVAKMNVEEGEKLYYLNSMEMKNFHSEELDRTFESVLFIDKISKEPILMAVPTNPHDMKLVQAGKIDVDIEPAPGGITIAELYSDIQKYENQTVIIKGKVTKFNSNIMGRNWIHIQDGTESNGNFDLTITSDAEVRVGEIVTFEGSIALNKDFGFNYKYDVVMEVAKLIKSS